jgi:hypothetical protein
MLAYYRTRTEIHLGPRKRTATPAAGLTQVDLGFCLR